MTSDADRHERVARLRAEARSYLLQIRTKRLSLRPRGKLIYQPVTPPPSGGADFLPEASVAALLPQSRGAAVGPEPVGLGIEPEPKSAAPAPPTLPARPLAELPMLGQGMVWRLENLGICSLEDLAACDPARLEAVLGPIGRLVRCELWIQAARKAVGCNTGNEASAGDAKAALEVSGAR